ncbi:MAG: hypothetical protein AB1757_25600 [Acidobacteriota bacterium]
MLIPILLDERVEYFFQTYGGISAYTLQCRFGESRQAKSTKKFRHNDRWIKADVIFCKNCDLASWHKRCSSIFVRLIWRTFLRNENLYERQLFDLKLAGGTTDLTVVRKGKSRIKLILSVRL